MGRSRGERRGKKSQVSDELITHYEPTLFESLIQMVVFFFSFTKAIVGAVAASGRERSRVEIRRFAFSVRRVVRRVSTVPTYITN